MNPIADEPAGIVHGLWTRFRPALEALMSDEFLVLSNWHFLK